LCGATKGLSARSASRNPPKVSRAKAAALARAASCRLRELSSARMAKAATTARTAVDSTIHSPLPSAAGAGAETSTLISSRGVAGAVKDVVHRGQTPDLGAGHLPGLLDDPAH